MTTNMAPFTDVEANGSKMKSTTGKSKKESCLVVAVVVLSFILFAFVIAVITLALTYKTPEIKAQDKDVRKAHHLSMDDVCTTEGCISASMELLQSINTSVNPCDDFFEFACGKWVAAGKGADYNKFSSWAQLGLYTLSDQVIAAVSNKDFPKVVERIAAAYVICSNYDKLEGPHIAWLLNIIQEVGGWPMIDKAWVERRYAWERSLALSVGKLFLLTPIAILIDVNFFDTTSRIIQIHQHQIEEMATLDREKILYVAKRIGNRIEESKLREEYEEVENLEKYLKEMSRTNADLMDDPKERRLTSIEALQESIPWINWLEFLNTIFEPYLGYQLDKSEPIIIVGHSYISSFLESALHGNISKRLLANYVGAKFIQSLYEVNGNIASKNSLLRAKDPLGNLKTMNPPELYSESCLDFYQSKTGIAIDFISYQNRKEKLLDNKMLDYYFAATEEVINAVNWLDEKTKASAIEKLKTTERLIGYPELVKDARKVMEYYQGLGNFSQNPLQNQFEVERFQFQRAADEFREKVDRTIWPDGAHGTQFNAFNVPDQNAIAIPAGIQIEPFFSADKPKYWNFGGIGTVLGHEITHSFDTAGSKRDKHGNIKNWWMPEAREEFDKRSKCFIEQYDKYYFGYEDTHVNGTNTAAENVADNGALHQSFIAYKKWEKDNGKEKLLPGLEKYNTYQLFFIAAAQPYCAMNIDPEVLYNISVSDNHCPHKFRFRGQAINFEGFAETFDCPSGSAMNPVKKCVIW